MAYFPYDVSKFSTVTVSPPKAPPRQARRNFMELVTAIRGYSCDAYELIEEALTQRDVAHMRDLLYRARITLNNAKLAGTDLETTLDVSGRAAPPTVPLEQRELGRMSLPNLPPMPHTVRPHREGWQHE